VRTTRGTSRRALLLCVVLLGLTLLGGAGTSKASFFDCRAPDPTGRQFCVTIEDQEGVSPSGLVGTGKRQVNVTAYQFYKFTVENKGGSTLTNGTLTATLTDHVVTDAGVASDVTSTAEYNAKASASFCKSTSTDPNTVSCKLPNIPAGLKLVFYLVYRTSNTADVKSTDLSGIIGFKEAANGSNGANPATLNVGESTDLEVNPELSVAWAPPGFPVNLGTNPTSDTQFSTLQFTVPGGHGAFTARASEGAGNLCAACFGEVVTTDLTGADEGTFSASNLFHLRISVSLDAVPGGNIDNVFVYHVGAAGPETIQTRCTSNPPTSTDTFPCILVAKDNQAKLLIVDIWGYKNGGWQPGLE
jgi:hypothetical protein